MSRCRWRTFDVPTCCGLAAGHDGDHDFGSTQRVIEENTQLRRLLDQACGQLEETYPIKGPGELAEWRDANPSPWPPR